jgi:CHAT domain-containing protein
MREARAMKNPSAVQNVAIASARLALDTHDPAAALRQLNQLEVGLASDWQPSGLRAEALLALGQLAGARQSEERAVEMLDRQRSLLAGPLRSQYLTNRVAPFARLVAIDLALADTLAAFRVAAAVPGRSIAERLGTEATQLQRVVALEEQIDSLPATDKSQERRAILEKELARARASYDATSHRSAGSTVDPKALEAHLQPGEALLTYLTSPDRLYLFVVRRAGITAYAVPIEARSLTERVRNLRELVAGPTAAPSTRTSLGELYDLLLPRDGTLGDSLSSDRLIIVPHGALDAIPFAALFNRRTGRFLIEDHVVSYLPSAAALMATARSRFSPLHDLVAFAPLADSLPGTAREVRAIRDLVPGTQLELGDASSEARVRAALAADRPIHIASHGAHNEQNPLFSLITVGARREPEPNDGRLEVREVLMLRTRTPFVFLSGCETGLTATATPFADDLEEGSLAQAFLVAGAANVIATLWRVDDADAPRLVRSVYERLARGDAPADALATAQRATLHEDRRWTWAAYAAWGAGSANATVASVSLEKNK